MFGVNQTPSLLRTPDKAKPNLTRSTPPRSIQTKTTGYKDVINYTRYIGREVSLEGNRVGILRFYGTTSFASGMWCGVELPQGGGKPIKTWCYKERNNRWRLVVPAYINYASKDLESLGKQNDGSVNGILYFDCDPDCGVFVKSCKPLVQAPSSSNEMECNKEPAPKKSHIQTLLIEARGFKPIKNSRGISTVALQKQLNTGCELIERLSELLNRLDIKQREQEAVIASYSDEAAVHELALSESRKASQDLTALSETNKENDEQKQKQLQEKILQAKAESEHRFEQVKLEMLHKLQEAYAVKLELANNIQHLKVTNKKQDETIKSLEDKVNNVKDTKNKNEVELHRFEDIVKQLNVTNQKKDQTIKSLAGEVNNLRDAKHKTETELHRLEGSVQQLNETSQKKSLLIKSLEGEVKNLRETMNKNETELSRLEISVQQLNVTNKKKELSIMSLESEINSLKETKKKNETELHSLRDEVNSLREAKDKNETEIHRLNGSIDELQLENKKVYANEQSLKKEVQELVKERDECKNTAHRWEKTATSSVESTIVKSLMCELESMKAVYDLKIEECKELEVKTTKMNVLEIEARALRSQIKALSNDNELLVMAMNEKKDSERLAWQKANVAINQLEVLEENGRCISNQNEELKFKLEEFKRLSLTGTPGKNEK